MPKSTKKTKRTKGEEIKLTPADDAALTRAYAKLAKIEAAKFKKKKSTKKK